MTLLRLQSGLMLSGLLPEARQVANGETETIAAGRLRLAWS